MSYLNNESYNFIKFGLGYEILKEFRAVESRMGWYNDSDRYKDLRDMTIIIVKTPFNKAVDYHGTCTDTNLINEMQKNVFQWFWTFNWSDIYFAKYDRKELNV